MKQEIMKLLSNQKQHDKCSLGYFIGHIDHNLPHGLFWDSYKRAELLEKLDQLLNTPTGLYRITGMQSFNQFRDQIPECKLSNRQGYVVCTGSYDDCRNRLMSIKYFQKNYTISFLNDQI